MNYLPINESKIKTLIKQCKHLNVFPIFLDHYFPRTESNPISDLLKDLVQEAVDYLSVMTKEEIDNLVLSLPPGIRILIDYDSNTPIHQVLLERIAVKYFMAVLQEDYFSFKEIIANTIDNSIVLQTYPELRPCFCANRRHFYYLVQAGAVSNRLRSVEQYLTKHIDSSFENWF